MLLHSDNDIAQMGRSGIQTDRECQMAWQSNTRGTSVMTELCVPVLSVCSGVSVIEFSLVLSKGMRGGLATLLSFLSIQ